MSASGLSPKRVIVTGGGGRLGSRLVSHLSKSGSRVAAVVVSEEEASRVPLTDEEGIVVKLVDVTNEASVTEAFDDIAGRFGSIDALVHTVGMWGQSPLLETSLSSWEAMIRVNLTSAFLCFREAVRHMDGPGTLIAMSSRQGADGGVPQQAAYSAAKAGIVRLVEAVSREFAAEGIRAHAIAPSMIVFGDEGQDGVPAADIVSLVKYLITDGTSLSGVTVRTYGSG